MWGKPRVTGFDDKALLARALDQRTRLSAWIEATKARDPVTTAAQQVAFECWLEEMSEDHDEDAAKCGVNPSLWVIAQAPAAPAPAPAPAPAVPKTYLVFFDFDKSDITPEAARIIKQAADEAKKGNVRVIVTGHADRSGATDYNQRLSERRAGAVRAGLVREGVAGNAIQISGRGENENLVPTADGAREPRNRRVEIVLR
jgi:outer membrane protein OmpA-like peptidoglycan-associated protein